MLSRSRYSRTIPSIVEPLGPLEAWPTRRRLIDTSISVSIQPVRTATSYQTTIAPPRAYSALGRCGIDCKRIDFLESNMFRILCLDGGGILGTFTASVLREFEEQFDKPVSSHFDLIVGTSTGGILALGLGLGFSSSDLLQFYQTRGPNIFPHTSRFSRARASLRQLWAPKLSQAPLRNELKAILGDRRFGSANNRLVIPAYDAIEGRTFLFKTAHTPEFIHDIDLPAIDIALATSAAPTYFQAARTAELQGAQYVDGGVWANNPSMIGLVEAAVFLNQPISDISILSIGTTYTAHTIAQHERSGALKWNIGLIDLLMRGQSESASAQAKLLLKDRYHRIDHIVPAAEFSMDDGRPEKIERLVALGRNQARKIANKTVVKELFFNGVTAQAFEPSASVSEEKPALPK